MKAGDRHIYVHGPTGSHPTQISHDGHECTVVRVWRGGQGAVVEFDDGATVGAHDFELRKGALK